MISSQKLLSVSLRPKEYVKIKLTTIQFLARSGKRFNNTEYRKSHEISFHVLRQSENLFEKWIKIASNIIYYPSSNEFTWFTPDKNDFGWFLWWTYLENGEIESVRIFNLSWLKQSHSSRFSLTPSVKDKYNQILTSAESYTEKSSKLCVMLMFIVSYMVLASETIK